MAVRFSSGTSWLIEFVLQIWQMPKNETVKMVSRDIPLVPNRIPSVFKRSQRPPAAAEDDDGQTQVIEKAREVRRRARDSTQLWTVVRWM